MANNNEKEAVSSNLSKLVLNNFVIQLCKKIKSARVTCTKKLKKQAIKLKEKKTENEEEKRKNISKANSCLKQIDVLKGYQLSNIAKFILLFDKSHDEVFNKPNSRVEEKALSRISHDEKIKNDISKFREKYPDWKKELPFLIKSLGVLYRKARMKRLVESGKLKTTLENEKKMLILLHELTGLDIDTKILKRDVNKQKKVPKLKKNIQLSIKKLSKKNNGVSMAKVCDDDESYSDCSMDDESLSIEEMNENGEVISERKEIEEVNEKDGRLIEEGPIKITSIFESCHSDKPLSSLSSNKKKKLKLLKNLDSEGNLNITDNSQAKGKNTPIAEEVKIPNLKGTSAVRQVKLNENQSEISFERNNNSQLDSSSDDDEPFFQKLHNQANNYEQDEVKNSKSPLSKKLKSAALDEGDDSDTKEMLDYDTRKYFKKKMFRDGESRGSRGRGRGRYTSSDRGFRGSRGRGSSRARNQIVSFNKPRDSSRSFRRFDNDESGGQDDLKFVSRDFIVGDRNDFDHNQKRNQFEHSTSAADSCRGNRGRGYRGREGRFGNDERGSRRGTRNRGDSRGRGRSDYSDKSSDRGRKKDGFMGSSNHMPLGERKKSSTSGGESMLHPSWIAKKNQASSSVASFQGKRTTFD